MATWVTGSILIIPMGQEETQSPHPVHFSSLTTIAPVFVFLLMAPLGHESMHKPHCKQIIGVSMYGSLRITWILDLAGLCVL
jgi:hypothetical protein